jgi:hypothetical protein
MKQTANNFNNTLENIFGLLIEKGDIKPSRRQTIKGSLNKYAALLGSTIATCLPKAFVLPPAERNALIDNGLARTTRSRSGAVGLGEAAIRNVKNDVSFILRQAAEHKLLEPSLVELASYQESRGGFVAFPSNGRPSRGDWCFTPKYALDPVPISLQNELAAYRIWTTSLYTPKRPTTLKRREITHNNAEYIIKRFAGYLVKFKDFRAEEITLSCLTAPQNLADYVEWYVGNQGGRYTAGVVRICSYVTSLAKYLQITAATGDVKRDIEDRIKEIKEFTATLPRTEKVVDKTTRWISLRELDAIGVAYDPVNFAKRDMSKRSSEQFVEFLRDFEQGIFPKGRRFRVIAVQASVSLMLRLLVRIPLRQRNLREMEWNPLRPELGRNLYKSGDQWHLRFRGVDMKIGHKGGKENMVNYTFPPDLSADLDRYMKMWRPLLVDSTTNLHCAPERAGEMPKIVDQEYVFLNSLGKPFTSHGIQNLISNLTYKYVKVAMPPHIARSVWATEYLKDKGYDGVVRCAYMLNDTIQTVLTTYADLLTPNCQDDVTSWLSDHLSN